MGLGVEQSGASGKVAVLCSAVRRRERRGGTGRRWRCARVRTAQGVLGPGGGVRAWAGGRAWAGARGRVAREQRRREKEGERKKGREKEKRGEREHVVRIRGQRSRVEDRQPSGAGWDGGEEKEGGVRSAEKGEEKMER